MNDDLIGAATKIIEDKAVDEMRRAHEEALKEHGFNTDCSKRPWWRPSWTCKCECIVRVLPIRFPFLLACGHGVPSEPVVIRWQRPRWWRHQRRSR